MNGNGPFKRVDAMLMPNYPKIVLAFNYNGWKLEIDEGELDGMTTYTVWANNAFSSAVAVPYATSRQEAIQRAKRWVDARLKA